MYDVINEIKDVLPKDLINIVLEYKEIHIDDIDKNNRFREINEEIDELFIYSTIGYKYKKICDELYDIIWDMAIYNEYLEIRYN